MWHKNFTDGIAFAISHLRLFGSEVDPGSWQGIPTRPEMRTLELMGLELCVPMNQHVDHDKGLLEELARQIKPNLPWADDHFLERVGGVPTNPGEAYKTWPWWHGQTSDTMVEEKFTHTYQERFWPKHAGLSENMTTATHRGIRYTYGDFNDLIELLYRTPYTRQATLPIFFPEDTGAAQGRTPCTLHYHFMLRDGRLNMWYAMRSCDAVRHFRDDLYLACRLNLWVINELIDREIRDDNEQLWNQVTPGHLYFSAYSFHVLDADRHLLL